MKWAKTRRAFEPGDPRGSISEAEVRSADIEKKNPRILEDSIFNPRCKLPANVVFCSFSWKD